MARQTQTVRNEPTTTAIKLATAFDNVKDQVLADVRKPASESKTKQVAGIGLIAGLAIGAWELAGM